jgi:hypothetical protein
MHDGLADDGDQNGTRTFMGMNYRIDDARRIVMTRGWGVVSTRDLQDLTSRILLDPRFDPAYRSLADLSEVTEVLVNTMSMAETATTPLFVSGTRRAIVAASDLVFGMASTFASISLRAGHEVRVFRRMSDAEAWLETGENIGD